MRPRSTAGHERDAGYDGGDGDDECGELWADGAALQAEPEELAQPAEDGDDPLAALDALDARAAEASEATRSWAVVHSAPRLDRRTAVFKLPGRKTVRVLQSLTRFWNLWLEKNGADIGALGPDWEQASAAPWVWLLSVGLGLGWLCVAVRCR